MNEGNKYQLKRVLESKFILLNDKIILEFSDFWAIKITIMKRVLLLFMPALLFLFSCGVEVTKDEIKPMLFGQSRGIIAGVDMGDTWASVKQSHPKGWEVREDKSSNIYQIRKDWEEGNNTMNLTFGLDDEKKIQSMEYTLTLMGSNVDVLREIQKLFIADFNLITLQQNTEAWIYTGKNKVAYLITLTRESYREDSETLTISVKEKP